MIDLPELMRVRAVLVSGEGILADDDLEVRLRGRTYELTRSRASEGVTGFVASAIDGSEPLEPERVTGPSEPETRTPLVYGDGPYDVDNDGFVGPSDAVDFVVPGTDACVIWTVVTESASIFCQGDEACCGELAFPNVESENPGTLVLTRETADGVAGNVLARTPDATFSEPLEFSFAARPERYETLDASCGDACDLDVITDSIELSIGSGRFTVDRVEVFYEPIGRALARESRSEYEVSGRSAQVSEDLSDRLSRGQRVRMIVRNESGFFVEDLRKDGFDALIREGRVDEATVDQPVSVFTTDALSITNIASVQSTYGLTGSGVTVCVVDTGVDVGLLRSERVSYEGWNVLTGTDDVQDGHGHGTQVAYPLIRAAPEASFVFVKALDDSGVGYESDVLKALDVCADLGAQVVSLSIGSGLYDGLCDTNIVAARVNELVANGTMVVAAAGNEGGPLLKSPACASNATAVIASDKSDVIWSSSSYLEGHAVLSAPSVSIETVDEFGNPVVASGTSMAAPFVSGAAALLLENSSYDPLVLRSLLVMSGDLFNGSGFSYARLNLENAILGVVTNDLFDEVPDENTLNETNGTFGILADPVVSGVSVVLSGDAYEVTYSASDADGDPLYNTTDWRVNGTSIAVLNAPFNVNVSTTTSGAVHDLSTYANNGTLSSGGAQPTWNDSCIVGGCYYFDGANDVLSFGDPVDGSLDIGDSSFTYGLWVYPVSNVGAYDIPLYKGGTSAGTPGYDFELGSGGWGAGVSDGTNIVTAVESSAGFTGAWYHVMAVLNRDTDRLVLYINGTEVANSSAATIGTVSTATDLQLGEQANGNDDFDGYIDEVLIFRQALSPSQVKAIYDAQLAGRSVDIMNESVFGSSDSVSARVYSSDSSAYSFADSGEITLLSSCRTISSPGNYQLANDLSSAGTCITINVSDVALDCSGYTINYSQSTEGYGILVWSQSGVVENVSIDSCAIVKSSTGGSSTSWRPGIVGWGRSDAPSGNLGTESGTIYGVNNVLITNATIDVYAGNYSPGVYSLRGDNWTIETSVITTRTDQSSAVGLSRISNGSVQDTVLNSSGFSSHGIIAHTDSPNWNVDNVTIVTDGTFERGIQATSSPSWNVTNTDITSMGSSTRGILLDTGSEDWYVINSSVSGTSYDFLLDMGTATMDLYVVNTTYSTVHFQDASAGVLNRGWYTDVFVKNADGTPATATINYTDGAAFTNPSASGNGLSTGGDGYYRDLILYEYSEDNGGTDVHNDYTFDASAGSYVGESVEGITSNRVVTVTIGDPISSCQTISTGGSYVLTQDLTATASCIQINADNISLSCAGHTINYSQSSTGYGVYGPTDTGYDRFRLSDCTLVQGSVSQESHAITLHGGISSRWNDVNISDIFIRTYGHTTSSLRLVRVENSTFENFDIGIRADANVGNDYSHALVQLFSANNTYRNFTIETDATTAHGIIFESSPSSNLTFERMNVTTLGSNSEGFRIQNVNVSDVYVRDSTFNTLASAFNAEGTPANNIWFFDSFLEGSTTDFVVQNNAYGDYYLINTTLGGDSYSFPGTPPASVHKGWYVDVYVNNTAGDPVIANITYDDAGSYTGLNPSGTGSDNTAADGTARLFLYEYTRNDTGAYYHNNYTINASKLGDESILSHNVTGNVLLNFTIGTTISSCQTISSSGVYTLSDNVSATGTCFTIASSDVTLNCAGHTISYASSTSGEGILVEPSLSTIEISDCVFVQAGNPGSSWENAGILVNGTPSTRSNHLTITNNTFSIQGTHHGINWQFAENSTISNITLESTGTSIYTRGIYLDGDGTGFRIGNISVSHVNLSGPDGTFFNARYLYDSVISDININSTAAQVSALYLFNSQYNVIERANISVQGSGGGSGIRLRGYTLVKNSTISYSDASTAIEVDASGTIVSDSIIEDTALVYGGGTGTPYSVYFGGTGGLRRLYFVNVSFNDTQVGYEALNENDEIQVGWRIAAYVNDTSGNALPGSTIEWESVGPNAASNDVPTGSNATGIDGWFRGGALYEYLFNSTDATYFQNHSISASKPSYVSSAVQYVNMSTNQEVFFTLDSLGSEAYEFTTCTQTGRTGPLQSQCDTAYNFTRLEGNVTVTSGIQSWTVPKSGYWNVTAYGAQGGFGGRSGEGGYGAKMSGVFLLTEGEVLNVLVGQAGADNSYRPSGGGASAVWENDTVDLLVVAGGGGAYGVGDTTTYQSRAHAQTTTSGQDGFGGTASSLGGTNGNGGAGTGNRASGGGGWLTDGGNGSFAGSGGQALIDGGLGGTGAVVDGGFGGGGATDDTTTFGAASGGGGYSGGGGGYSNADAAEGAGGGGGSFNAGDNQTNVAASNTGQGSVVIAYMAPPPTARLSVWDGTDAQGGSNIYDVGDQARFFANYSNWSSSAPISGAGNACSIAFDTGSGYGSSTSMTYNSSSSFYEYSRNFTDPGTFSYNVSCTSSSYLDLDVIDTISYGNFQILDTTLTPTGDIFTVDYTVTGALSPVNTTDWRGDGVSFAVLNMPFNVNVSNTTSGAVTDLSSYSNNGTLGNGVGAASPTWNASCVVGGCYEVNGSQHVRVPGGAEFNITAAITVEAWIYPTAPGQSSTSVVFGKPRAENAGHQVYAIRFDSSRIPSFRFAYSTSGISTLAATGAIPLDEWTHVVGTYDGTTQRIYLNGVQNTTSSISQTIATSATDVMVGGDYLWTDRNFIGLVDEPKIYNRVLSADQILANYNAGSAGEAVNTWEGADATSGENLSVRVYSSNEEEYVFADSNSYEIISACGTITTPGVYALAGNLSATATCMQIDASNVVFDCGGNTVSYSTVSSGFGIDVFSSEDNVTIRNCVVTQGSSSSASSAISATAGSGTEVTNLTIENVVATTSGSTSSHGIIGYYVEDVVIRNSTFTASGTSEAGEFWQTGVMSIYDSTFTSVQDHGIDLAGDVATQVLLEDSTFITNANSHAGINVAQSNITMNRINATNTQDSTASVNPGVYLRTSSFEGIVANGSYFEGGSYALLRVGGDLSEVTIANSTIQTESNIFRTTDAGPIEFYFINVTSNSDTISWGGTGTRLAHWGHYVSVYVNDTRGNPIEANVSYVDGGSFANNPTPSGTVTTSSSGTNTFVLYEWDEIPGPTRTDHNDYAISVSKAGWSDTISSDPQTVNDSLNLVYTLTHPFDIDSCQTISSPGSYEVISDISASATCMYISTSDVELDCNGYTLNYGQSAIGYGVLLANSIDNVTVRNCIANQDASPGTTFSHAFFVDGNSGAETTNVTFENNTGYTKAGNSVGLYAEYASGIVISNHTSETNGASSNGIAIFDTTGATISSSSSTTNGSGNAIRLLRADDVLVSASTADALGGGYGLYAGTLSNLTVSGSTIIASGSSARAFQTDTVTGATIIGSVINATATSTRGLLVNSASTDIEVYNSTINSDLSQDVYLVSYSSANSVRFINVTYDESSYFFESNAGTLSVGYYLDLYVQNAGLSPVSATVNYTDNGAYSSLNPTVSDTGISVGGDGYFRDLVLYERTRNATAVYYHTNYSFDVYNPSYTVLLDASRNFTTNEQLTFTLSEDTCTPPGSGDWTVQIGDNCVVSSSVDIYPNALNLEGSGGTFTITSSGMLRISDLRYEPSAFDGSSTFILETGGELRVEP